MKYFLVLFVALAMTGLAETNTPVELPPIVVEGTPISKYRAETISTATLFDVPPEEVPGVVDVLTEDFIDEMNPTDLHDLLRHQAGVFTAGGKSLQDRSPGLFTLRGFGGTEAKLDGTLGFAGAMGLFMDPSAFERIEIVKGPVGATVGGTANAMGDAHGAGGSINLILKRPSLDRSFLTVTPRASFSRDAMRTRFAIDLNEPFAAGVAAFRLPVNVEYSRPAWLADGARARESYFLAPSLLWHFDDTLRLGVNVTLQYTDQPAYQGIPVYRGKPLPGYSWDSNDALASMRDTYRGFTIQSWLEWDAAAWLTLRSGAGFTYSDVTFEHLSNGGSYYNSRTGEVDLNALRTYEHSGGQKLSRTYNIYQRATAKGETGPLTHTVTVQGDYNRSLTQGRQFFATVASRFDEHVWVSGNYQHIELDKIGILLQDYIAYGRLRLLGGARCDYHKSNLGNRAVALSPRAGISYLATDWLIPFANLSLTEAPNFGRLTAPDSELTSSWCARQIEGGLRIALRPTLWLTASIYQIDQENLPSALVDDDGAATGYYETEGAIRSRGTELSLAGNVTPDWSVYAAYAFNSYENRVTGDAFDRFPPHTLTFSTSRRITGGPLADCVAGFAYRYRHRYDMTFRGSAIDDAFYVAAAHVFDCSLEVPLRPFGGAEAVTLSLALKNIFNEHYIESNRHYYQGFPGEQRTFEIALRGTF